MKVLAILILGLFVFMCFMVVMFALSAPTTLETDNQTTEAYKESINATATFGTQEFWAQLTAIAEENQ